MDYLSFIFYSHTFSVQGEVNFICSCTNHIGYKNLHMPTYHYSKNAISSLFPNLLFITVMKFKKEMDITVTYLAFAPKSTAYTFRMFQPFLPNISLLCWANPMVFLCGWSGDYQWLKFELLNSKIWWFNSHPPRKKN